MERGNESQDGSRRVPVTTGSGWTGLLKGPMTQMSSWQEESSWLDSCLWTCLVDGEMLSREKASLLSVLHISQTELGKGGSQLQCFLKAAHVLACGLGRHVLATAFTIHQA